MPQQLELGDLTVDVVLKDIKNVHLSVNPPAGRVRIAAPKRMKLETLRLYAISKLTWIRQQQRKMCSQVRETPREYLERESHYLWGKRYLLKVTTANHPPQINVTPRHIKLQVRPGATPAKRRQVMESWYRQQLSEAAAPLIEHWSPVLDVQVARCLIRRMKTRWGSCNPQTGVIRLNTDLAKKPPECMEYIIVHEMTHLLEPTHNQRFQDCMSRFLPDWRRRRQILNRLPVRHEEWGY